MNNCQWRGDIAGYIYGRIFNNNIFARRTIDTRCVNANYTAGGVTGYAGESADVSGNVILNPGVRAGARSAGGIVGCLSSGTVSNNRAYTASVEAGTYVWTMIGEIAGSPSIVKRNYYNVITSITYYGSLYSAFGESLYVIGYDYRTGAGSNEGGTEHAVETLEEIAQNGDVPETSDNTGGNTNNGQTGNNTGNTNSNTGGNTNNNGQTGNNTGGNTNNNTGNNTGNNGVSG